MEIVVIAAVVIVIAVMLGVNVGLIMLVMLWMMAAVTGLMALFFVYSFIRLLGTKPCEGRVVGLREHEKFKYPWAWYEIDGREYRNIFPGEVIWRRRLYTEGKVFKLRFDKKRGVVFDMNALICVLAGLVLSALLMVVLIAQIMSVSAAFR